MSFKHLDFFKDSFPSTDVVIFGNILHDWKDSTKELLVKKAYEAIKADGACLIYERILDNERRENIIALKFSV